jgi:hypothetical protein
MPVVTLPCHVRHNGQSGATSLPRIARGCQALHGRHIWLLRVWMSALCRFMAQPRQTANWTAFRTIFSIVTSMELLDAMPRVRPSSFAKSLNTFATMARLWSHWRMTIPTMCKVRVPVMSDGIQTLPQVDARLKNAEAHSPVHRSAFTTHTLVKT